MEKHSHPNQKQLINRMSRVVGHAESVKRMLEEEKECSDILIQIAAVKSALNNVGKLVLKDHMNHCIVDAVKNDNPEALKKLDEAIDKFMK
ncbi:metal-sensing transcriptional repressor [Isachenkonia alkalipeptolytica]|uniref:Metal-sensing transcriptional repressor n=1 Tax=Isachenkonia alkalipeptolytica TaxID=2565777 RepID=A0AA43XJS8_9CLOT|nr:metal-sensing transcriptional repressor [Isachenkonia alkalipeptolytica]NBG88163.1 metal-sensing transcriptional repressor [Isachenkonia alkalipeptolytica]